MYTWKECWLFFYLKKWFKNGDEVDIYMRITVDKISAEISAKRKCLDERWNSVAGRVNGKTEYAKSINAWLDVLQRKVYDYRKQLVDNEQPITVDTLKRLLQGRNLMYTGTC